MSNLLEIFSHHQYKSSQSHKSIWLISNQVEVYWNLGGTYFEYLGKISDKYVHVKAHNGMVNLETPKTLLNILGTYGQSICPLTY